MTFTHEQSEELQNLCHLSEWATLGTYLNSLLGYSSVEDEGCMFNEAFYIFPNVAAVKNILHDVEPLTEGNCWTVYFISDISEEQCTALEDANLMELD